MKSRGETQFVRLPHFAARLYSRLAGTRPLQQQYREIAAYLTSQVPSGRVLDVGMGPGWLLLEIHRLNPALQLSALDVSPAMIRLAQQNLAGVTANLMLGNACAMGYESDSFDAVVCSGSFYLWDRPEEGLEEVHRVLKPGCSAHLFETNRDYDRNAYWAALRANLNQVGLAVRLCGPLLLGKALAMAYRPDEVAAIVARTSFAGRCQIENIALAGLPIWMHIRLTKAASL